jgi:hypothetical protein
MRSIEGGATAEMLMSMSGNWDKRRIETTNRLESIA